MVISVRRERGAAGRLDHADEVALILLWHEGGWHDLDQRIRGPEPAREQQQHPVAEPQRRAHDPDVEARATVDDPVDGGEEHRVGLALLVEQ